MRALETYLRNKGLNRYKLGKELDISPPTIREFLSKPTEFRAKHIQKMAEITNGNPEEITGLILENRKLTFNEDNEVEID